MRCLRFVSCFVWLITTALTAHAYVYNLNFGPPAVGGIWNGQDTNWGTTLTHSKYAPIPPGLTISSPGTLVAFLDPFANHFYPELYRNVFWGNLGGMGTSVDCTACPQCCVGLGAGSPPYENCFDDRPLSGRFLQGMSNPYGEVLYFTFDNPGVSAVELTLIGVNLVPEDRYGGPWVGDIIDVYWRSFPVWGPYPPDPVHPWSSYAYNGIRISGSGGFSPSQSSGVGSVVYSPSEGLAVFHLPMLYGYPIYQVAVVARLGEVGVGGIAYNPVPEPEFFGVLGAGLAGLWALRRRLFTRC